VIKSFKCKETAKLFNLEKTKIVANLQKIALRKLEILNAAIDLKDLRIPPANNLESLKGNRQGQYSIRINDQWRICFNWEGKDAKNVEIVDYH
jgi:proteic killer suppression protein